MTFLSGRWPVYSTAFGAAYCGDSRDLLKSLSDASVNLVMTSPPFALQRKKEYGNKEQSEYIGWLGDFARLVHQKLKSDGSFVLDLGGAYRKGVPARSLYNFRVLIDFCDNIGFFLAEDFYWFNPLSRGVSVSIPRPQSPSRRADGSLSVGFGRASPEVAA